MARVTKFNKYLFIFALLLTTSTAFAIEPPKDWKLEWPKTDFSKSNVPYPEIISGGPAKDGIPALNDPVFKPVGEESGLVDKEPVIVLTVKEKTKAYPLRILMWHEIVNDEIEGVPVVVTYCPLCNASIAYDRRVGKKILDFGVSGKLRHSDMIMYDRQTESWWQQFLGIGILGEMTDTQLTRLPSSILPFAELKKRYPMAQVLTSSNSNSRSYGQNPYLKYDTSEWPFLYRGEYNGPIPPLAYVISIGNEAWPLSLIRDKGRIEQGDILIDWQQGMNSALDEHLISTGRDLGYVTAKRKAADGRFEEVSYDMTFAFVFQVFHPTGILHAE